MFKKMFNKVKAFADKAKAAMTTMMIAAMTMPVYATAPTITVQDNIDVNVMLGKIAGGLLSILQGIGGIFIVWGGFQFAMALRDEDAASKSRAMLVLISGVCMVGLKALLKWFGILA
ncbi:MAG: hypothetical protein UIM53_03065 [Acutalibacteraceae bacterium]|nr:hypothetical protein [Acutalibacteraceae bacterium]